MVRMQDQEDDRKRHSTQGGRRNTRDTEGPEVGEPIGTNRNQGAVQGRLRGGQADAECGGISRHAARGAEMSGGGWRVAGVGNVQVDRVPRQERKWGVGLTER